MKIPGIAGLPTCYRDDCFSNREGHCQCLSDNKFKGGKCPFYKDREQQMAYLEREKKRKKDQEDVA